MKTKIFLLLSTFLGISSVYSQHVLREETSRPRSGDRLVKQEMAYKDPGRSGKDVLWDFSRLTPILKTRMVLSRPVEQLDLREDFSKYAREMTNNDSQVSFWQEGSFVVGSEQGFLTRYNTSGDSLLVWGYENPYSRMENTLPEVWLRFPFSYKDKLSSYFGGEGNYSDKLSTSIRGSVSVEADAYGTLILPDKDTLENVLRVKIIKTAVETSEPAFLKKNGKPIKVKGDDVSKILKQSDTLVVTEVLRWYGEGYRYPVFENRTTYRQVKNKRQEEVSQAFLYSPKEQEADYLPTDQLNLQVLDIKKQSKAGKDKLKSSEDPLTSTSMRYNLYPNPTRGNVEVELYLERETTIQFRLYSVQGSLLYQSSARKATGVCSESIPSASLAKGTYVLQVKIGETTVNEKIIKQ